MAKVEKVRLGDIVVDESIRHRGVERFTVNEYRRRFRAGEQFPPLKLERKTRRLVWGHHRYQMYRGECEPDYLVDCILADYKDELELWVDAIEDNKRHGRPLDTWDRRNIVKKLQGMGASMAAIAKTLGEPVDTVQEWANQVLIVIGRRDGQVVEEEKPVKRGMEALIGTTVTDEFYEREVVKYGFGNKARRLAFHLRRLLRNECAEDDELTITELVELQEALNTWLAKKRVEVAV